MYCRNCGHFLAEGAKFCGACGAQVGDFRLAPPKPQKQFPTGALVGVLLGLLGFVGALILLTGDDDELIYAGVALLVVSLILAVSGLVGFGKQIR